MERGLLSRNDLAVARQHAQRERIGLAEAFVALGLVPEVACYAALAGGAGGGPGGAGATRPGVLEARERCYPNPRDLDILAARLSGERPVVETPDVRADLAPTASTAVELCDHIIGRAVEVGASDVHV